MNFPECYPWQNSDYNYLLQLKRRLPHAVLLSAPNGIGALELATRWIFSLLCDTSNPDGSYCGTCNSCTLLEQDSHPDYYPLTALDEEKSISIAAVRAAVEFLSLSTHRGKYKIILIEDANLLNPNSSNALLKILEEPPYHALFILLSNNPGSLLPTIRSRCHKYKLAVPDYLTASKFLQGKQIADFEFWLKYNHNCPLLVQEIDESQLKQLILLLCSPSVDNIYALNLENKFLLLEFLTKWLSDLISYKMAGELSYFDQYVNIIGPLMNKLNLEKAFYLQDKVNFLLGWVNHPLNFKLQIENLLFQYQQIFVK